MDPSPHTSIDAYIDGFPPEIQTVLRKVRETIRRAAPEAAEAIKYQIPTFVLGGNLVHFAAFKHHLGFYPTPSAIRAFAKELSDYQGAKGSVQFPFDREIPYELIGRIVRYRVKEVTASAARKKPSAKRR